MLKPGQKIPGVLHDLVISVGNPALFPGGFHPDFETPSRWIQRTEGFLGKLHAPSQGDDARAPAYTLNLQVDFDGSGHLFCGRAAEKDRPDRFLLYPTVVGGNTTRFLALLGKVYNQARHVGLVDIGLALTGLRGSVIDGVGAWASTFAPYDRAEYRKTARVSALTLNDDPVAVARSLLMPLFNAMSQNRVDPFPKKAPLTE
jgi:hypothetical protein